MRNYATVFFSIGKVGDWKNYFTVSQSEKLDKRIAEGIQGSMFKFTNFQTLHKQGKPVVGKLNKNTKNRDFFWPFKPHGFDFITAGTHMQLKKEIATCIVFLEMLPGREMNTNVFNQLE